MRRKFNGRSSWRRRLISDDYMIIDDINLMLRLAEGKWSWFFEYVIIWVIDVFCVAEFLLAILSLIMEETTAENLGATVIDIACMNQIATHVHAALRKRSEAIPALNSLRSVAKYMQESSDVATRRWMRRWAMIIRALTAATFFIIAICLFVCTILNPPAGRTTPVATWPAPTPDMHVTRIIVAALQYYATFSGSAVFCVVSSVHFGAILYAVVLFTALSSGVRRLHLHSESADDRFRQFLKYVFCHHTLLRAMADVNEAGKVLLFSRINATFALLVYTGMSISLGYVNVRVMWMTMFGFVTLMQCAITGQFLKEGAERVGESLYECHWESENPTFRKTMNIALMRSQKPLVMSTWFCKNCDLPFSSEFVQSWTSAVQMMYKTRTSRKK